MKEIDNFARETDVAEVEETVRARKAVDATAQDAMRAAAAEAWKIYGPGDGKVLSSKIESVEIIGAGPHSVVFRGQYQGTDGDVTIKVDSRDIEADENYSALEKRWALLKALGHPNIPKVIDIIVDWPEPDDTNAERDDRNTESVRRSYVITQYIKGESADKALDVTALKHGRVLDWLFQILDALQYLHDNGVTHGNVCPSSIVIRKSDGRAFLLDFTLTEKEKYASLSGKKTGQSIIRRPEGDALQAERSQDIYGAGATLYELLTGDKLKRDLSQKEKRRNLKNHNVTEVLADVIVDATEGRYASATDMQKALAQLPDRDSRKKAYGLRCGLGIMAAFVLLLAGATAYVVGNKQEARLLEMDNSALNAMTAWNEGRYSDAFSYMDDVTDAQPFDPPCTPDTQRVLAEMLGVYNFIPGYRPLRTIDTLHGVTNVAISPSGKVFAAMTHDKKEDLLAPPDASVYLFESASGRQIGEALEANGTLADLLFLDDDTLIYPGKDNLMAYSVAEGEKPIGPYMGETGPYGSPLPDGTNPPPPDGNPSPDGTNPPPPDGTEPPKTIPPVSMSASGDRSKFAALNRDEKVVIVYDKSGFPCKYELGKEIPPHSQPPSSPEEVQGDPMDNPPMHLLALDRTCQYLAVSFSDGELWLYHIKDNGVIEQRLCLVSADKDSKEKHIRFEGGFWGDFFFYSIEIEQENGDKRWECALYRVTDWSQDRLFSVLTKAGKNPIRADVSENGVYLAISSQVLRVSLYEDGNPYWDYFLPDENFPVLLVRHIPGRVLSVTENGVIAYGESGQPRQELPGSVSYRFTEPSVAFSEDYAVLSRPDRVSVFVWENHEAERAFTYDTDFPHTETVVHSSGESVMLYQKGGFRIYRGNEVRADMSFNPVDVSAVEYIRGLPGTECLKVTLNGETRYYDAESGDLIPAGDIPPEWSEAPKRPLRDKFVSEDYRVVYQRGEPVRIYQAKTGKLLRTLEMYELLGVWQNGKSLLLSGLSGGEPRSLLLNPDMETTAVLHGLCEWHADGTMYADNRQGDIFKFSVRSWEELRKFAEVRRNGME